MASVLKKININLELLTDVDMLLMIDTGIKGKCANHHAGMLKQMINTWRIAIKALNHHI